MAEKPGQLIDKFNASDAFDATGAPIDSAVDARRESRAVTSNIWTDDDADETEQIKARIEETRSQMGETFDAIQEKLSIQNISEQVKEQVSEQITSAIDTAKESVYEATLGNLSKAGKFMKEIGRDISQSEAGKMARRNPFPLVLIGLGVGLLAYEGFAGGSRRSRDVRVRGFEGKQEDVPSSGTIDAVRDAADGAYTSVAEVATDAYRRVGDYAGTAYEKVGEYGTQAREQYEHYIEENPLAVGAVALAVGAAVGMALPSTSYETEYMGDYSRQVLDRAQSTAGDLIEKVKDVATADRSGPITN